MPKEGWAGSTDPVYEAAGRSHCHALEDADWDMFQHSTADMFREAVVGFIRKLVDNTTQKITILQHKFLK